MTTPDLNEIDLLADAAGAGVPDSPSLKMVNELVEEWDKINTDLKKIAVLEEQRKERKTEIETRLLPDAMELAGVTSFVTTSGRTVTIDDKVNGNIPALSTIEKEKDPARRAALMQRRQEAYAYIMSHWPGLVKTEVTASLGIGEAGLAARIIELLRKELDVPAVMETSVHPSTLNSHFKELKNLGKLEDIPVSLFALYTGPFAKIK